VGQDRLLNAVGCDADWQALRKKCLEAVAEAGFGAAAVVGGVGDSEEG